MKRINLPEMSIDQLVGRFVQIGVTQHRCERLGDTARYSRLYWQMEAVEEELKARNDDARTALLPLYDHPDMEVRLKAAKATLAVAPQAARQALEQIRISRCYPQAMDAGMCIRALDEGIFKPK